MDGYEATRKIRALPGGDVVKIVAITASVLKEQREDILAAGCDNVVYKPYQEHEIFETMAQLLDIKYLYKDAETMSVQEQATPLAAEMLSELPSELLQELRDKSLALDRDGSLEVIARIAEQAPEVAAGFRKLVGNYQMVELRDLLKEK